MQLGHWSATCRLGWLLFLRDFRFRYRQAYLGYMWAVGRVLFTGLPLILVGNHFNLGGDRSPGEYAVFALSGLILWQIFWDAVISPQWMARRLRRTMVESAFRREAVLVAGVCYVIFNASLYMLIVAAAFTVARYPPPLTAPLVLLALPTLILAGLAVGAMFIPLTFVYLDFRYGLPLLSPLLLWTAPVFYESPEVGLLAVVNRWNPLTYLIDIPRQWLVTGAGARDVLFPVCLVVCVGLFLAGARFYRHAIPVAVQSLPQR